VQKRTNTNYALVERWRSRERWITKVFWSDVVFYSLVGAIPCLAIILASNVFIGQGKLSDIPEDYEPKPHEYYKSPVSRWFAKYVYDSPQRQYEKNLDTIWKEHQKERYRIMKRQVDRALNENQDVRGWYYVEGKTETVRQKEKDTIDTLKYFKPL